MTKKTKTSKKTSLSPDEIALAAMAMTVSNLGHGGKVESARSPQDIREAYRMVDEFHSEAGVDIRDEYDSWVRDLKAGNRSVLQRWTEIKSQFTPEGES